jgi:predicted nuclease with TOPRIM domain
MAAASNKPGPVHFALISFVILSVVLGITTYMFHREYSDRAAKIAELEGKSSSQNQAIKKMDDEVQALKNLTGQKFETVLDPSNPTNPTSVSGAAKKDINDFGQDLSGVTYAETLQKLREALDASRSDVASKITSVADLQKNLKDQQSRLNSQIDLHRSAQEKSEADKRDVISNSNERLTTKQKEVDRLNAENNQSLADLAQERESRTNERKKLQKDVVDLENRIDFMKGKIDALEMISFEEPDGYIRRIDTTTNSVYIDLGQADGLKTRMTFGVYSKEGSGVGRGAEDVKARIEVTQLIDAHLAVARVIQSDLTRPIVPGDLIYTPIWSPGLIEKISIVGPIDLDNDGRSDREEFRRMLAVSGCILDNEINDEGERIPAGGKITVQTKFLVVSDIPDASQIVGVKEKEIAAKIGKQNKDLLSEARVNGVRVVKFTDFLAHIGYLSKRRLFRPGDLRPYTLKAGAASSSSNESIGDRTSDGKTSDLFDKKKKSAPQSSDGTTSKLFGK